MVCTVVTRFSSVLVFQENTSATSQNGPEYLTLSNTALGVLNKRVDGAGDACDADYHSEGNHEVGKLLLPRDNGA